MMGRTVEQNARYMLERIKVKGARNFTNKDVQELADLIADRNEASTRIAELENEVIELKKDNARLKAEIDLLHEYRKKLEKALKPLRSQYVKEPTEAEPTVVLDLPCKTNVLEGPMIAHVTLTRDMIRRASILLGMSKEDNLSENMEKFRVENQQLHHEIYVLKERLSE